MRPQQKKKAIVLAGTIPHIAVIENLKRRGYETILLDYNPNCPARAYADRYINESTLDKEAVLRVAEAEQADLVISVVGDHINAVCCYVAEKLGLPHPYSYENALNATRKDRMKPLLKAHGIPTSDFYTLRQDEPREIRLEFPLVVKPSDANSSKGVFRVDSEAEFYDKVELAFAAGRDGKVIVERFIDGTEIQVDCLAVNGKAHLCMVKDMLLMDFNGQELQAGGFSIPGRGSRTHMAQIREIAQQILDAYHIKNGAFFYQAKCNKEGVFVLEAAARMAGGTSLDAITDCTGIDYVDMAIDGFLGKASKTLPRLPTGIYMGRFLYMRAGTFGSVRGFDELLREGTIVRSWVFVNPGTKVTDSRISSYRIAAFMVSCRSEAEGEQKMQRALERIAILDSDGNDRSNWRSEG